MRIEVGDRYWFWYPLQVLLTQSIFLDAPEDLRNLEELSSASHFTSGCTLGDGGARLGLGVVRLKVCRG